MVIGDLKELNHHVDHCRSIIMKCYHTFRSLCPKLRCASKILRGRKDDIKVYHVAIGAGLDREIRRHAPGGAIKRRES